eukprot:GGOE01061911.1.p1 GENE.GGOE01061911.1~~GGOE01061911.1.p1  ORF type:complete len:440 (+),score=136.50 GGOE01061911.1:101-1420(+)
METGVPIWFLGALLAVVCYLLPRTLPKPNVVGMDLGTTYSGVGVFRIGKGEVYVVPNALGNLVIPSWVAFTEAGILVGDAAREQDLLNPENTIYDMKRFIGRKWDTSMEEEAALYPFKLVDNSGIPSVAPTAARFAGQVFSPQQIGSFILRELKETAERYIGGQVTRVVMAVPVDFDDDQIAATKEAATLAGMEVAHVLTEPTAAAMAYGLHEEPRLQQILVYDMGGGTLDVSLLACAGGTFSVLAVDGNNQLGGEDVNRALMAHLAAKMLARDQYDVHASAVALQQLRDVVEAAKRKLSEVDHVTLQFEVVGYNFTAELTRHELEEACRPLFEGLLTPIETVFTKSGVTRDYVDSIVLVGGSTRIPFVRQQIRQFFGGRLEPYLKVPPELAVAIGTGIQAAIVGHYWPLPTAAIENWDMIRSMRHPHAPAPPVPADEV